MITMTTTCLEFVHPDGAAVRADRSEVDPDVWRVRIPPELPRDVYGHRPFVQVRDDGSFGHARLAEAATAVLDALVAYQRALTAAEAALSAVLNDLDVSRPEDIS